MTISKREGGRANMTSFFLENEVLATFQALISWNGAEREREAHSANRIGARHAHGLPRTTPRIDDIELRGYMGQGPPAPRAHFQRKGRRNIKFTTADC